jgi:glyoxylase-like metal-dependent hydrolase (beta-lactamase superfamily II)
MTTQLAHIETAIDGLHATEPQPLPFAPATHIRAFALERGGGNLLLYSTGTLASSAPAFEALGGISRHYLNHRHEAMFASDAVAAPLFVHEREAAHLASAYDVRGTFSRRHMLDEDFEVIPTPGHTSGATAYLWDNGRHRFLFTGDSVMLDNGEWIAAVLESSDRAAYLESLELLREVEFDVLVPWAASAGQPYLSATSRSVARRRIDAIAARLRRGEDR